MADGEGVVIAAVDPALQHAAVKGLSVALEKAADEEALVEAVQAFIEARIGGTRLDVTLSGGVLKGTTAGGKKFVGKNAATGSAAGSGFLDKSSSTIYTATTKYEFKPGKVLNYIYFYDASNKKVGTWTGKLLPSVTQAFSGPGSWTL